MLVVYFIWLFTFKDDSDVSSTDGLVLIELSVYVLNDFLGSRLIDDFP
jgi:hypothetical protein